MNYLKHTLFLLPFILAIITSHGQTMVNSYNASDTVWEKSNSPYLITGNITIPAGKGLIIQPGVAVIFKGYYKIINTGRLTAKGTSQDKIMFKGDSLNPNVFTYWQGINTSGNIALEYCTIKYSEGIETNINDIKLMHCEFTNNTRCFYNAGNALCRIIDGYFYNNSVIFYNDRLQTLYLTNSYFEKNNQINTSDNLAASITGCTFINCGLVPFSADTISQSVFTDCYAIRKTRKIWVDTDINNPSNKGVKVGGSFSSQDLNYGVCENGLVVMLFDKDSLQLAAWPGFTPHCYWGRAWKTYGYPQNYQVYYSFQMGDSSNRAEFRNFINALDPGTHVAMFSRGNMLISKWDQATKDIFHQLGAVAIPTKAGTKIFDSTAYVMLGTKGAPLNTAYENYATTYFDNISNQWVNGYASVVAEISGGLMADITISGQVKDCLFKNAGNKGNYTILLNPGSQMLHTHVEGLNLAVKMTGTSTKRTIVDQCGFLNNDTAILINSFNQYVNVVSCNTIENNHYGIVCNSNYRDSIKNNIICGNIKYNVVNNGTATQNLTQNCFCSNTKAQAEAKLYDKSDNNSIGPINYNLYGTSGINNCKTLDSIVAKDKSTLVSADTTSEINLGCIDYKTGPEIDLNTPDTICHKIYTPYNSIVPTVTSNRYDHSAISLVLMNPGTVNPNVAGVYTETWEARDVAGNISTKKRVVIVGDCDSSHQSIKDISFSGFRVGPNPASTQVKVYVPQEDASRDMTLSLIAVDGRMVYKATQKQLDTVIDTRELPSGIYSLIIMTGNRLFSHKIVIQN